MEALVDMTEAAKLLGLTKSQLYEACRSRSRMRSRIPIPRVRIGRKTLFRPSSLNEWVKQLEQSGTVQ